MWICTRCATHHKEQTPACPTCGGTQTTQWLSPSAPPPDPELPPLIKSLPEPDLQTPWTRKGVEIGIYLGVGLPLLLGVFRLLGGQWMDGLFLILCSPMCGLLVALVFGHVTDMFEDILHRRAGRRRPRSLRRASLLRVRDNLFSPRPDESPTGVTAPGLREPDIPAPAVTPRLEEPPPDELLQPEEPNSPTPTPSGVWAFRLAFVLMVLAVLLLAILMETHSLSPTLRGRLVAGLVTTVVVALCFLPMLTIWRRTRGQVPAVLDPGEDPDDLGDPPRSWEHMADHGQPTDSTADIVRGSEDHHKGVGP